MDDPYVMHDGDEEDESVSGLDVEALSSIADPNHKDDENHHNHRKRVKTVIEDQICHQNSNF